MRKNANFHFFCCEKVRIRTNWREFLFIFLIIFHFEKCLKIYLKRTKLSNNDLIFSLLIDLLFSAISRAEKKEPKP